MKSILVFLLSLGAVSNASAELNLPSIFSDRMVLQRGKPLPFWGWADPGQRITVGFGGLERSATAAADGRWEVLLPELAASNQGREITVLTSSGESRVIRDVLVGEVWILAGQSNMGWSVKQSSEAEAASQANHPWLRSFSQLPYEGAADQPARDVKGGRWSACTPETAVYFSAVGFFFAEALHARLGEDVPIALVHTAMGGTAIESWIDLPALEGLPEGRIGAEFFRSAVAKGNAKPHMLPAVLYNGKIAPLQPFATRGVLWYQGESNASDTAAATRYGSMLKLMIRRWRDGWRDSSLPFIIIQLPGYDTPSQWADWPTLRAQQAEVVAKTPNTALVVTLDLGSRNDIHPPAKRAVGERAARCLSDDGTAAATVGPKFLRATRSDSEIRLTVDRAGGLHSSGQDEPKGFEISEADGVFSPIAAKIEGDAIVIRHQKPGPVNVRYAWKNWPEENVRDGSGLPLAPFITPELP